MNALLMPPVVPETPGTVPRLEGRYVLSRSRSASAIAAVGASAGDRFLSHLLFGGQRLPTVRYLGYEFMVLDRPLERTNDN